SNYSYYPILVTSEYSLSRDELYDMLKENNVLSRKYFYPLISNMPMYRGLTSAKRANLENANYVADRVLCLPIFTSMSIEEQDFIIEKIRSV
ncbi:TPA: DegT/DnrJ/EryC1/StrS family aminotransferase, partial [Escherichia coli]|nr:DegT/DnrJ/EryC1/StrS family aminotransferase [Escherichia coli]